jgi:hypothetical protein
VQEMDAYDAYFSVTLNSLIPAKNSLFVEIFSLLICVGNCAKSDRGAAVSCSKTFSRCLKIAKFPVKFPDSREIEWRRARSALQRQPGSHLCLGSLTGQPASLVDIAGVMTLPRISSEGYQPSSNICVPDLPGLGSPTHRHASVSEVSTNQG